MMNNLSVGDIVFLQPLGNHIIRSKPNYLLESKVTKIAKKYIYLSPVERGLPSDYARVERDTLMYYDFDSNSGWVLWHSREEFEDHKTAEMALGCISDLCRYAQDSFRLMDCRLATQPAIEQIKSICMEMTEPLAVMEINQKMPNAANKEEIVAAAQDFVQAYISGSLSPTGLHPAYQFVRSAVMDHLSK